MFILSEERGKIWIKMVNNACLRHTTKEHGAARQQKISDRQIKNQHKHEDKETRQKLYYYLVST